MDSESENTAHENPSKPNIFQLIQLFVTKNNSVCASENIAHLPTQENPNTSNRLQVMEEIKKYLGEMRQHKRCYLAK
jgi:hypothetical protein